MASNRSRYISANIGMLHSWELTLSQSWHASRLLRGHALPIATTEVGRGGRGTGACREPDVASRAQNQRQRARHAAADGPFLASSGCTHVLGFQTLTDTRRGRDSRMTSRVPSGDLLQLRGLGYVRSVMASRG